MKVAACFGRDFEVHLSGFAIILFSVKTFHQSRVWIQDRNSLLVSSFTPTISKRDRRSDLHNMHINLIFYQPVASLSTKSHQQVTYNAEHCLVNSETCIRL